MWYVFWTYLESCFWMKLALRLGELDWWLIQYLMVFSLWFFINFDILWWNVENWTDFKPIFREHSNMVHSCNGIMIGELFRKWFFDYLTDSFLLLEKFYFLFPFLFALECLILRVTNQQWNIMFFCWFCVCYIIGSSCDDKYRTNHFRNLFVVTLRATFFQSM